MKHISLADLAKVLGISRAHLYRDLAIQQLISSGQGVNGPRNAKLYPIDALPADIRKKIPPTPQLAENPSLDNETLDNSTVPSQNPKSLTLVADPLPPDKIPQIDAWVEIFRIRGDWCQDRQILGTTECDREFASAVADRQIPSVDPYLAAIAWGKRSGLSRTSIARQRERFRREGLAGYARDPSKDLHNAIDRLPEIQNWILDFATSKPEAPIALLYRRLAEWHQQSQCKCPLPCLTAVREWLKEWQRANRSTWLKATAPDKWKSEYRLAFGTHDSTTAPNQIWELDSTIADLMVEGGRHYVLGLIDVHTRQAMVLVSKSSQASAVLSLLRSAILKWGVPASIRIDNGSDYVSQQVKRFCAQAEIRHDVCTPGTPQAKPYIERFWGTFNHSVMPEVEGYTGHNVATAQVIRSRRGGRSIEPATDAAGFQGWCDSWLLDYNDRPHQGIDMRSPDRARSDALAGGWQPTLVADVRQLDLLLASAGKRKVGKQGIRIDGGWYVEVCLATYVGKSVWVSRDVADLGRIYVFDEDNNYIGEAIDAELLGIDRREIALQALALQKADIAAKQKAYKQSKSNKKQFERQAIESAKAVPVTPLATTISLDAERSRRDPNAIFGILARLWEAGASIEDIRATCTDKQIANASARAASGSQNRLIVTNSRLSDTKKAEREFVPWLTGLTDRLHAQSAAAAGS